MPRLVAKFLPDVLEMMEGKAEPTENQLLLQLVYGLAGQISDEREAECYIFTGCVDIPNPLVPRLMQIIIDRSGLNVPENFVQMCIDQQRHNHAWIPGKEQLAELDSIVNVLKQSFQSAKQIK